MSNKTQLQTNNAALDSYIARINAAKDVAASLPEADSGGGGGGIETCTVVIRINFDFLDPSIYYITQNQSGEVEIKSDYNFYHPNGDSSVMEYTAENVCCNSMMVLFESGWMLPINYTINGTASMFEHASGQSIILSPSVSNENCVITIHD